MKLKVTLLSIIVLLLSGCAAKQHTDLHEQSNLRKTIKGVWAENENACEKKSVTYSFSEDGLLLYEEKVFYFSADNIMKPKISFDIVSEEENALHLVSVVKSNYLGDSEDEKKRNWRPREMSLQMVDENTLCRRGNHRASGRCHETLKRCGSSS